MQEWTFQMCSPLKLLKVILCKPPCLLLYQSMKYLHVAAFSMFVSKNKTGTPKVIKPVSRPACRASLLLQSPAWWPRWCPPAPVRRSAPSSCSGESSLPFEAWRRCGSPSPTWVWWSLCSLCPLDFRGDLWGRSSTLLWMPWRLHLILLFQAQRWHRASSLGRRSWCSRPSGKARWRHKRSTRLSSKAGCEEEKLH